MPRIPSKRRLASNMPCIPSSVKYATHYFLCQTCHALLLLSNMPCIPSSGAFPKNEFNQRSLRKCQSKRSRFRLLQSIMACLVVLKKPKGRFAAVTQMFPSTTTLLSGSTAYSSVLLRIYAPFFGKEYLFNSSTHFLSRSAKFMRLCFIKSSREKYKNIANALLDALVAFPSLRRVHFLFSLSKTAIRNAVTAQGKSAD